MTYGDSTSWTEAPPHSEPGEAPQGPGRWVELVPVEVFGMSCDDHEPWPKHASWGLMDAVQAWSDCNRAEGRIYRVEDVPSLSRLPGETVRLWVPEESWPFFAKRWGSPSPAEPGEADMLPPTATRAEWVDRW